MGYAVFCFRQDLSGGCPAEGLAPNPDAWSRVAGPFPTQKEARAVARAHAASRPLAGDRDAYVVLETFVAGSP